MRVYIKAMKKVTEDVSDTSGTYPHHIADEIEFEAIDEWSGVKLEGVATLPRSAVKSYKSAEDYIKSLFK